MSAGRCIPHIIFVLFEIETRVFVLLYSFPFELVLSLSAGWSLFRKTWKSRGIFLSKGTVGENRQSGKSRGNHDCAVLSASITNSNFTNKSTQNAHICIEVFKICPGPPLLGDGHLPRPHPSHRFVARSGSLRASAHSLQYLICPFPTLLEKSGKSQGISFGLESGHPVSGFCSVLHC